MDPVGLREGRAPEEGTVHRDVQSSRGEREVERRPKHPAVRGEAEQPSQRHLQKTRNVLQRQLILRARVSLRPIGGQEAFVCELNEGLKVLEEEDKIDIIEADFETVSGEF